MNVTFDFTGTDAGSQAVAAGADPGSQTAVKSASGSSQTVGSATPLQLVAAMAAGSDAGGMSFVDSCLLTDDDDGHILDDSNAIISIEGSVG